MIACLDTQIVIWLMQGDVKQLSRNAKRLIESADLLVSPIVTFEIGILREVNLIKFHWHEIHAMLHPEAGLRVCDIAFERVTYVAANEGWTRDPFDRLIVAHAKANGAAYLISADEVIRKHYQRTVWL